MNEISDITTPELKPVITYLYNCLFDPTKKFDSLEGFDDVVDNGIVNFKNLDSCRKISLTYKGERYELGLFNYKRDNGNTLGIRNGETDRNLIQYVLDKFIQLSDGSVRFIHDGVITGNSGKTKDACIENIKQTSSYLVRVEGSKEVIDLGNLENGYQFEDKKFQKFISSFIEYSILRNNFKNDFYNKINLKTEFANWFIANDGKISNYYSKQFGSKKERIVEELDLYEQVYKEYFAAELFIIDLKESINQIDLIKRNIYDKTTDFSKFSEKRSNDRPRAILGKKKYLRFLLERFSEKKAINYWIFQGNPKF